MDRVTLLVRGDTLQASQVLPEKALRHPKIDLRLHTEVKRFDDEGATAALLIRKYLKST